MTAVILTIHTLIVLGLIVVVLLQRSDGGALGIGGGGSGGGFMTGRGAANALTRTTSILAALFFATSLGLAILAGAGESAEDVIDDLTGSGAPQEEIQLGGEEDAVPSASDLLESLGAASETDEPATADDLIESLGAEAPAEAAADAVEDVNAAIDEVTTAVEDETSTEETAEETPQN